MCIKISESLSAFRTKQREAEGALLPAARLQTYIFPHRGLQIQTHQRKRLLELVQAPDWMQDKWQPETELVMGTFPAPHLKLDPGKIRLIYFLVLCIKCTLKLCTHMDTWRQCF